MSKTFAPLQVHGTTRWPKLAMGSQLYRRAACIIILAALLPLAIGRSHAAADPVQVFAPAWARFPDSAGWQMLVSPPFPVAWPPDAAGRRSPVVRYAFAMRLRPGTADGVEVAAPWAQSMDANDGAPSLTLLASGLRPLGIQGVRPLTSTELTLIAREAKAEGLLQAGGIRATDPVVRAATCQWIGRNGLVAATITPLHPAFMRWLACGDAGSHLIARPQ